MSTHNVEPCSHFDFLWYDENSLKNELDDS